MFWAAVWILGGMVGVAAAAALAELVRLRWPDHYRQVHGLDPTTRQVVGPPALRPDRAAQLLEQRRRAGVQTWETRRG